MTEQEIAAHIDEWVKSCPPVIQALIREFPLNTVFNEPDGNTIYLMGYNESDMLIVSKFDPLKDYDRAVRHQEHVCADHFRRASGCSVN